MKTPIKSLGLHKVPVLLYPEIEARIIINVARSAVEAEHQAKGDALKVVEVTSMGDLGLEVGAALGDAEIAAAISGGFSCMPLGLDSHMPGSFVPGNMACVP